MNRTLVTFAAELLQSEQSDDDHKIAVSVLHVVIGREERRAGAIQQIRSSEQLVGRLVRLLSSESAVLDACLVKAVAQTSHDTGETRVSIKSDTKEIIVRSLQILCKLADDPEICTEMCNSKVLVSKIMASLTPSLHIAIADEAATVEAVRASLDVLDKLTSRTGCPDIQQLVIMLSDDGASKEHRTVMAQLLAQFCANCRTDEDRDRLRPIISTALSTVLKTMCDTQCTNDDADSWKLLGSYLGLTKHICVNLAITADAFAAAVKGIPEGDHVFVTKLKEIVDTCMDRFSRNSCVDSDDDCLVIMKSAAKLATWMMKTNRDYIKYFCQVNILEKLEAATVAMANLEKYMLLTGGFPDESELHGETLSSLMESVKDSVSQQQA
ncbi:hypothetical protein HU200_060965 [Digitaria exilis]|uniref:Uncharacterized protein n=1 Tax=Digitaria exilis TaxID=1010633 RepID=A0A835AB60_9POAL|nr:hypothetical protein HU200_060965 [Digitaria exilis]